MAVLIFKLRYVPDDEVQEINQLLIDNDIDYYETSAGSFGISMPGLWLKNEEQLEKARQLIDEYQQFRQERAREDREQGPARTFVDMFKDAPARYISVVLAIILICYFMIFFYFKL